MSPCSVLFLEIPTATSVRFVAPSSPSAGGSDESRQAATRISAGAGLGVPGSCLKVLGDCFFFFGGGLRFISGFRFKV